MGVVTVLFNSEDVLPGFFKSLAAQYGIRYKLYVIDNSPTDIGTTISRTMAVEHGIDAVCTFNNANVGVAKGNNQGIEMALADNCTHVLLANNDTEFGPPTVLDLWHSLANRSDDAVTAKIHYFEGAKLIWYGGGHINAWTMRTPHYGDRQVDSGQFDQVQYVDYAPTCFMMLTRKVFDVVGMMDECYFVYGDDTDFVWRMHKKNLRIRFAPNVTVLHKVSTSTGGSFSPFTVYYTNRNRIYFIRKNLHGFQRLFALLYTLTTRLIQLSRLPRDVSRRGWAGVRDGLALHLQDEKATQVSGAT